MNRRSYSFYLICYRYVDLLYVVLSCMCKMLKNACWIFHHSVQSYTSPVFWSSLYVCKPTVFMYCLIFWDLFGIFHLSKTMISLPPDSPLALSLKVVNHLPQYFLSRVLLWACWSGHNVVALDVSQLPWFSYGLLWSNKLQFHHLGLQLDGLLERSTACLRVNVNRTCCKLKITLGCR